MLRNVEELETISFSTRLKELMNQYNGLKKPMSQSELKRKLDSLSPDNREVVTTSTISKWVQGKSGLRKNKAEILNYLSIIFNVDVNYLDCKQIEKRMPLRKELSEVEKLSNESYRNKLFIDYLELIDIMCKVIFKKNEEPEEKKVLIGQTIYKGDSYKDKEEAIKLYYKGKSKTITPEEFEHFRDNIFSYSEFLFTKL